MSRPRKVPTERKYDRTFIQSLLVQQIRKSSKSRDQIAKEMSPLVGEEITVRMLNGYTAESQEDNRWPAQFDIAFCEVVGNYKLLEERVKRAGFRMIGPKEEELLRLGRAFEAREKAQAILDAKTASLASKTGGAK
jgi:hypothetical protein